MRSAMAMLASLALAAAQSQCFTANGKTALHCTRSLADGPVLVYNENERPEKAVLHHYEGGKLCADKRCRKCMASGGAWTSCKRASPMPVQVMWPAALLLTAGVVVVPVAIFLLGKNGRRAATTPPSAPAQSAGVAGVGSGIVEFLLRFASAWWFPLVAALGTAVNMFTIIFTGATVVLFLAAVLGQPRKWYLSAVANAAGATFGTALLLLIVRERGLEYLNETFPALLASPAWAKATGLMQSYGVGGMLLVSCMPIILHPVIAFGMLSGMSNTTILSIVMAGRTIKYLVMSYVTANAPGALRFFGIKGSLVEYATAATAANNKAA